MDRPDTSVDLAEVEDHIADLCGQREGAEDAVTRAVAHHLSAGGSRVRARLGLSAACALSLDAKSTIAVAAVSELLHNASLIHDDLQDRSAKRRGRDSVWRAYGDAVAICAGDVLISAAYAAAADLPPPVLGDGLRLIHQRIVGVVRGQALDLSACGSSLTSQEDYETMAAGKSGPLLSLPLELALLSAGHDEALPVAVGAATRFAVAYQISDDLEDVKTDLANGEVNIVGVLSRSRPQADAVRMARALARDHYHAAARTAQALPLGAGCLLAEAADQRAASLREDLVA